MPSAPPNDEALATALLQGTNVSPTDAARLVLELLESSDGIRDDEKQSIMTHCRQVMQSGVLALSKEQQTRPFHEVLDALLQSKAHRRYRTLAEIRQYGKRLMRDTPSLRNKGLRQLSSEDCQRAVEHSFQSPSMRRKAYIILHSLFTFAQRRSWCAQNPISIIIPPLPEEARMQVLSIKDIKRLLQTALLDKHIACAPALGFMLWAGIRPREVERLLWADVDMKDRVIYIQPKHSKTGGARQVNMQPVLLRWLKHVNPSALSHHRIIPKAWTRRWRELREAAGFEAWKPDILRHSFASYHLKQFRDVYQLQMEMGHSSVELLRTRYLAMEGITSRAAKQFWGLRSEGKL